MKILFKGISVISLKASWCNAIDPSLERLAKGKRTVEPPGEFVNSADGESMAVLDIPHRNNMVSGFA